MTRCAAVQTLLLKNYIMFVSKLQTNIRQFLFENMFVFAIDKRMFVYYNAVIESKQMFAVMQGGYDHERNEEEKLQKNK